MTIQIRKTLLCMFGAIGGGARGFQRASVTVAGMEGQWECLGSMDVDAKANQVFARRIGVPALDIDFADRRQYVAIHGRQPAEGWREATPDDVRRATNNRRPDCVFITAPCKGLSGLLPESKSVSPKYAAMNGLSERALWMLLEAWRDDPVPMILFENVPRLVSARGRAFADELMAMLAAFGYASRETVHDCGELGGLGQTRKRALIVVRHPAKVPNCLYEPPKRPLRSVGDVIGGLWLPGDPAAGSMHRVPRLQWKTWVRLAFVEAGSDWRSLNRLTVEDGYLRDYLIVPDMQNCAMGVRRWDGPCGTVQSQSRPANGAFSIADPRVIEHAGYSHAGFRVAGWEQTAKTITGAVAPGSSAQQVADPRYGTERHGNVFRVVRFDQASGAVTGNFKPTAGGGVADPRHFGPPKHSNELGVSRWGEASRAVTSAHGSGACVADPRGPQHSKLFGKYHCAGWDDASRTVISGDNNGAYAVADPRAMARRPGDAYVTGGHYGVTRWGRAQRRRQRERLPRQRAVVGCRPPSAAGSRPATGRHHPRPR
jgi:site-specific DNA-cytosine methylase